MKKDDDLSEPCAMDLQKDKDDEIPMFVFPEPDMNHVQLLEHNNVPLMRWIPTKIPQGLAGKKNKKKRKQYMDPIVDLRVMMAMQSNHDNNADLLCKLAALPLLPIPIYQSPLYCMIARQGKGGTKQRFTDSIATTRNLGLLMEYYQVVYLGMPKENNDLENQRIRLIDQQFTDDLRRATDNLYEKIADLYHAYNEQDNQKELVISCIQMITQFTFYYIHLQERFLYRALVQPKNTCLKIPLEQVLTPNKIVNIRQLPAQQLNTFPDAIMRYFATKDHVTNRELLQTGNKHMTKEWFNVADFQRRHAKYQKVLYAGWLDPETATEYFKYLDVNNVIRDS